MSINQIRRRIDHIYTDLESNVTRIYGRRNLHIALDLCYHSVLRIPFGGEIKKGYLETLVIGDSRCGKTQVCKSYLRHYQLGSFIGGENVSFAGLVGGLEQMHDRWNIKWGAIPLNHKRLLMIDELSGVDKAIIAALSQIRSEGRAEITKVRSARTNAMARLAWFSNPRKDRPINAYNTGCDAIIALIGPPEDIARFDLAVVLEVSDVKDNILNAPYREKVEHMYTSELCHDLVLWAWSRKPSDIKITKQAYEACFKYAKQMYTKYASARCPLVTPSEQKIKLARMATALACRLFSTQDGVKVDVLPEHVEFIHEFLTSEYDAPAFNYDHWSQDYMPDQPLANEEDLTNVLTAIGANKVRRLLTMGQITIKDLEELTDFDRPTCKTMLSTLTTNGALAKVHTFYVKTPPFIKFLKNFMANPPLVEAEQEY